MQHLFHASTVLVDLDLLMFDVSGSNTDIPDSVGLSWMTVRPDAENSYLTTHNTHYRQTSVVSVVCLNPPYQRKSDRRLTP